MSDQLIDLALEAARKLQEVGADGVFSSPYAAACAHEDERWRQVPAVRRSLKRSAGEEVRGEAWIAAWQLLRQRTHAYAGEDKVDMYELRVLGRAQDLLLAAAMQLVPDL